MISNKIYNNVNKIILNRYNVIYNNVNTIIMYKTKLN